MPEHGDVFYRKWTVGNATYFKTSCFCAYHGEIDLFTCGDWDAAHGENCEAKAADLRQMETADFERMAQNSAAQKMAA